uniref:B9 domain-containing protein 1 n=1 Tax=Panagrolaimus superbus TaxID=310955 RepID=A0A914Z1T9_9BILA
MQRAGPSASSSTTPKSKFLMMVTGEISVAEMINVQTIYCKYFYVFGTDWKFIGGIKEGVSATSSKGVHHKIALNTPIEATFSSTNPFKWPQIVLACYGPDLFGNDVIRGYGSAFLPTVPGRTERKVAVFVPEASTTMHKILGFFTGRRAEFVDPRTVSTSEGREVTRVSTQGLITITFDIVLKDMKKFGYDVIPQTLSRVSDFPMPVFNEAERPRRASKTPSEIPKAEVTEIARDETVEAIRSPDVQSPSPVEEVDDQRIVQYEESQMQ